MRTFKSFFLGIIVGAGLVWIIFTFTGNNPTPQQNIPALATINSQNNPFEVIYNFYQAIEKEDINELQPLVTSDFLYTLANNKQLQKIYKLRNNDPSLKFSFFLINEQQVDFSKGTALARGSAKWVSSKEATFSFSQEILIKKDNGQWKIENIKKW